MMKDKLALRMKGRATFQLYTPLRSGSRIIGKKWAVDNAIQTPAFDITARRLIVDPASAIDTISLYYQGNLVCSKPIVATGIVTTAEVFFQTTFLTTDFNGSFDEARLTASGAGNFSIITGLVGAKSNIQNLLVTWNIQIT